MGGPSWLTGALAAAMVVIALYCASRLVVSRLARRETERDADAMHLAMGVAMAGMLAPRLTTLPGSAWAVVFAAAAVWFAAKAARPGGARQVHSVPHLIECAAMVYMFWAMPGTGAARPAHGAPMAGMSSADGSIQALAVVLALCMLGHVVWSADRLTALTRARTTSHPQAAAPAADPSGPTLAPRLAACYKIAMSLTMGYMLILML